MQNPQVRGVFIIVETRDCLAPPPHSTHATHHSIATTGSTADDPDPGARDGLTNNPHEARGCITVCNKDPLTAKPQPIATKDTAVCEGNIKSPVSGGWDANPVVHHASMTQDAPAAEVEGQSSAIEDHTVQSTAMDEREVVEGLKMLAQVCALFMSPPPPSPWPEPRTLFKPLCQSIPLCRSRCTRSWMT